MRVCCFYLTEKQEKKKEDFDSWYDYEDYVSALVETGDRVKVLCDWGSVRQGQMGTVCEVSKNELGFVWVTVQFDRVADHVKVMSRWIEVLN